MEIAGRTFEEIVVTDGKNRVLAVITEELGDVQVVGYGDTKVFVEEESHLFKAIPGGRLKYSPNSERVVKFKAARERKV